MLKIPITSEPNQSVFFTITVNGRNLNIGLDLRYINETCWVMDIIDRDTEQAWLTNIPLFPAIDPSQNILGAYEYLQIGEAYIARIEETLEDGPTGDDLGAIWFLIWNDNLEYVDPKGLDTGDIPVWEG